MKKYIILLLTVLLFSCGKENMDPVFNNSPLVGYWISQTGNPVFVIKDLTNGGTDEKYYEYQEGGLRYLRRTYYGITTTYQITYISTVELRIVPRFGGAEISLLRAGD